MSQHSGEIKEDEVSAALAYDETPSDPPYEPPDDEYLSGVSTSELIKTGIYSVKISPEENAEGDGKIDNLNIGSPFTHSAAGESGVEPNNQADPEGGGHEYEEYSDSDIEIVLDPAESFPQGAQAHRQVQAPAAVLPPKPPLKRKASFIKIIDSPSHGALSSTPYPREDGTSTPPSRPPELTELAAADSEIRSKTEEDQIYTMNLDEIPDTPWRKPGVDISDYFNYGFNEHSWKEYASKVKLLGEHNANLELAKSLSQQHPDWASSRFGCEQDKPSLQKNVADQEKWDLDRENETDLADMHEGCQLPWTYDQQVKEDNIALGNVYGMSHPEPIPFCEGQQIIHNIPPPSFLGTAPPLGVDRPPIRLPNSVYKSRHLGHAYRYLK